eukprot:scaffold1535_cov382-Prasinococcus_capsulatus_cf.AAC.66
MWHSDSTVRNPRAQLELAEELSDVLVKLPVNKSFEFFHAFVVIMRREWLKIDRLRLDKYYTLVRLMFRKALVGQNFVAFRAKWRDLPEPRWGPPLLQIVLMQTGWSAEQLEAATDMLTRELLLKVGCLYLALTALQTWASMLCEPVLLHDHFIPLQKDKHSKTCVGFTLHVCEIYLDELNDVVSGVAFEKHSDRNVDDDPYGIKLPQLHDRPACCVLYSR